MEKLVITADDISISGNVMTYTRDSDERRTRQGRTTG